jgi:hypothetical protein
MSRRLKLSFRIIVALLIVALASWCWYFATRPAQRAVLVLQEEGQASPPAPQWRSATAKERAAVIRSIVAQLEAFKADRYELAARYQSSDLKRKFGTIENFRKAIKGSYPQFAHYKSAKFGAARASHDGKLLDIPITLIGSDNVRVRALYHMALENNVFRVAGVEGGGGIPAPPQPKDNTPGLVT